MEPEYGFCIKDLPGTTTENDLRSFFSRFGNVIKIHMKRLSNNKKPLPFAFVYFDKEVSVNAVFKQQNELYLGSHKLQIKPAMKNTTVMIHGIPTAVPTQTVTEWCSQFGPIKDLEHTAHLGCCFATFVTRESAENCFTRLKNTRVLSQPDLIHGSTFYLAQSPQLPPGCSVAGTLMSDWGDPRTIPNTIVLAFNPKVTTLGRTDSQERVELTENEIKSHFEKYGEITKVDLHRVTDGNLKGSGKVSFLNNMKGINSAASAVRQSKPSINLCGLEITVSIQSVNKALFNQFSGSDGIFSIPFDGHTPQLSVNTDPPKLFIPRAQPPQITSFNPHPLPLGGQYSSISLISPRGLSGTMNVPQHVTFVPSKSLNHSLSNSSLSSAHSSTRQSPQFSVNSPPFTPASASKSRNTQLELSNLPKLSFPMPPMTMLDPPASIVSFDIQPNERDSSSSSSFRYTIIPFNTLIRSNALLTRLRIELLLLSISRIFIDFVIFHDLLTNFASSYHSLPLPAQPTIHSLLDFDRQLPSKIEGLMPPQTENEKRRKERRERVIDAVDVSPNESGDDFYDQVNIDEDMQSLYQWVQD
ncbi:hypothetical protein BLNAU_16964 [Blattamonas nauphoetae]|uniref:RRM domain-containing protein n=1 Tax=Blattamonas nauphoetae TaxID=2049346 RepID=A0ABQ9X7V5_9EUKA|nr:hypothetical protein BLNAU_16964 [Blattamonas nauphoetae]